MAIYALDPPSRETRVATAVRAKRTAQRANTMRRMDHHFRLMDVPSQKLTREKSQGGEEVATSFTPILGMF
jgi:hypothetical protein